MTDFEVCSDVDVEAARIAKVVEITKQLLLRRYPGSEPVLRGVHPKDHGCVKATLQVHASLRPELQVGLFAEPGKKYETLIRFSNASNLVGPDSRVDNGVTAHGSRGMAIKVMGVTGEMLEPPFGSPTQDFLMVNHPVFAFANVADYELLNDALIKDPIEKNLTPFFVSLAQGSSSDKARVAATKEILGRIRSAGVPVPYQNPPVTPVDNDYFSAAPFLFGSDRAMKFMVKTKSAGDPSIKPDVNEKDYLRKGLKERLKPTQPPVEFEFMVQVRTLAELKADDGGLETQIENACTEWKTNFESVATIIIEPQDFDTDERKLVCENLFFTPWHCLKAHQPIGGINRMRKAVYEASAQLRHLAKEPASIP